MTTVPPSGNDGDRPLFAGSPGDSAGNDRPFDAPVIGRRVVTPSSAPSRPSTPRVTRPLSGPPSPPAVTPAPAPPAGRGILVGRINGQVTATTQQRHFFGLATLLASLSLLFARGARNTARGTVRATTRSTEVTARRFQVQLMSGEYLNCLMAGEPAFDDPKKDDYVGISGRARKDHFAVRSVEIFSGPAGQVVRRVRAKHPLDLRIMRWLDRGSFVLAALIVAGAIALVR